MAKTDNLADFLTGLADKFRSKLGGTALINPQSFESKIDEVYQKGYDDAPKGTDVSDTTATAADVLQGKIFYGADGTKQTGEVYVMDMLAGRITNDGGTISGGSVTDDSNGTIGFYSDPYGFPLYLKGTGGFSVEAPYSVVAQAIGLTGDKIVSGNTVLGVAGTAATGGGSETGLFNVQQGATALQDIVITISNPMQIMPKRLLLMMITDGFYDFGKTTTYALAAGLVDFETNAATLFGITSGLGVFTTTASDFATVSGNTITFSVPADVDLCFLADKTYFYSVEY